MAVALVTGGGGFIGANLCARLLRAGHRVRILDDLSRVGAERNVAWLAQMFGAGSFDFQRASVADRAALSKAVAGVDRIYHLAGQVAVTCSVEDPAADFEANAVGTFYLLEAARLHAPEAIFLYASTNKVYGSLAGMDVVEKETRFELPEFPYGIAETAPLDFHSPYGCSKGAGDQYVRDYARIYGLRTIVLRQSCVYGPRQFGHSGQGWMAWFVLRSLTRERLVIHGNGKQVRDVLFIDDLMDAYDAAVERIERTAGEVYNVGGGPANSVSLWSELAPMLSQSIGGLPEVSYAEWRPGDQKVFISDIRKIREHLGWSPKTSVRCGLDRLVSWLRDELLSSSLRAAR